MIVIVIDFFIILDIKYVVVIIVNHYTLIDYTYFVYIQSFDFNREDCQKSSPDRIYVIRLS